MTRDELKNSGEGYARLYRNAHLVLASVFFDRDAGHLIASYFYDREPDEDDQEECELFCGELIGNFRRSGPARRSASLSVRTAACCGRVRWWCIREGSSDRRSLPAYDPLSWQLVL